MKKYSEPNFAIFELLMRLYVFPAELPCHQFKWKSIEKAVSFNAGPINKARGHLEKCENAFHSINFFVACFIVVESLLELSTNQVGASLLSSLI